MIALVPRIEVLLHPYAANIGSDFDAYRYHAYRVATLCVELSGSRDSDAMEKIAIAAAFHDLGIWTDGTFDYLPPSIRLVSDHLARIGRSEWREEVTTMVREHHKLLPYRGPAERLVEPFRRADLVDLSMGLVSFSVPRSFVRELYAKWPSCGFHKRLVGLTAERWRKHPLSPLPMVRW